MFSYTNKDIFIGEFLKGAIKRCAEQGLLGSQWREDLLRNEEYPKGMLTTTERSRSGVGEIEGEKEKLP